ncbi:FG-GAP and VCBS repeat-containing protein [Streptomyces monticola]|uniref:FG-GAP and VCBS repeat-containing protein n=1 Tax=Streptomyces monticola TaxID=2666263 RepID=A0ABW2JNY1_9ACTN
MEISVSLANPCLAGGTVRRSVLAALAVTAFATPLVIAVPGSAHAAPVPPRKPVVDFNHDGYADLVISGPQGGGSGDQQATGYVSVVYGSASGPDKARAVTFRPGVGGVPGQGGQTSGFGWSHAAADLDGDTYTDLVVGGLGDRPVVLWGAEDGLTGAGSVELPPLTGGQAGDFNGDGHMDLVSGEFPPDDDPNDDESGMTVSYGPFTRAGKPARLDSIQTGNEYYGPGDFIVGDLTGDGVDDLVTSHGFEETAYSSSFWKGGKDGLPHAETKSIASTDGGTIADVNGDGYGDLVVRDNGTNNDDNSIEAGTLRIEYGSTAGPDSAHAKKITQDTPGVPGVSEGDASGTYDGDQFGYSLSAADVTGDGIADIAVGIPGEDIKPGATNIKDAGSVVLLKGAKGGVTGAGSQAFTQSTDGVPGASEARDGFGHTVLLRDVDGDKKADLTVGVPEEDGAYAASGAVWVLRGATGGLTTTGIDSFGPKSIGAPEKGAQFGWWLGR